VNIDALRLLIRQKVQDARLPYVGITRLQGSPSAGERCDACEVILSQEQLVLEATTLNRRLLMLHVRCYQIWEEERQTGGPAQSESVSATRAKR
jgi:hypothetical protein